ncbi:MAG: NAD(P)/FAD-dependent oxidoreductase [Tenacibaculum sp.]
MNVDEVDYLVVGLGLAGIAFTDKLLQNKKSFIVFENNSQSSSIVAGGIYNPIVLKRFTLAWEGHKQLQYALPVYANLENLLKVNLDIKLNIKRVFSSVQEQNNWYTALDKSGLSSYMLSDIEKNQIFGINSPYGFGQVQGTGRINTSLLISNYKKYLKKKGAIVEQSFNYSALMISNKQLSYKGIKASKVVFCEGYGLKQNPFFNYLPLRGNKGETINIYAPDLQIDFLLKSSVFVMPLNPNYYKVGATFNFTDKTHTTTEQATKELTKKLNNLLSVPYKIVQQVAGIRPTVKDRRPLVGKHPQYSNLAILNGLGARGVMTAPTVANSLYKHLEKDTELDKEIDISRFD